MTLEMIFRIALILVSVGLGVTVISYMVELRRYVEYLEKKLERYQMREIGGRTDDYD